MVDEEGVDRVLGPVALAGMGDLLHYGGMGWIFVFLYLILFLLRVCCAVFIPLFRVISL